MAETPFSPEPGGPGAAEVPVQGGQEPADAPGFAGEPAGFEPAPQEPAPVASAAVEPAPAAPDSPPPGPPGESFEPAAVTDPQPQAPWQPPAPESPATEPAPDAEPGPTPAVEVPASVSAEIPQESAAASQPAAELPGVAATIEVPPLEPAAAGEGGEWELLLERLSSWWNSGELGRQWQRIRGPLKGVAILVAVLLALRLYGTVVSTIDSIPLVSGLLELAGLITVLQFGTTRLLRSSDRQEVLAQWRRRWQEFRGRD